MNCGHCKDYAESLGLRSGEYFQTPLEAGDYPTPAWCRRVHKYERELILDQLLWQYMPPCCDACGYSGNDRDLRDPCPDCGADPVEAHGLPGPIQR